MNYCEIEVDKIRSYQVLLYKNGYRSFPKPIYKTYKKELHVGMAKLKPMKADVPLKLTLKFNVRGGVDEAKWVVKMLGTGNTSKLCDTKEEALAYHDPIKHFIEERELEVKYGAVGDADNSSKPIIDYLEEIGIISNDRYVMELLITKTFNNDKETIDVLLEELSIVDDEVISFK